MRAVWVLDRLIRLTKESYDKTIKGLISIAISGDWTLRF